MKRVLSWLKQPLFPKSAIQGWMAVAAGVVILLVLIIIFVLIRRKKKKKAESETETVMIKKKKNKKGQKEQAEPVDEEPVTEQPEPLPEIELANLQGVGNREEQQDAFGISRMDRYEEDGLLAVLCDGMGGMAEGGMIAVETASQMVGIYPWAEGSDVPGWIAQRSARVFQQFRGHGGTTLVATLIKGNQLTFWCVGDSDLFLLRDGKLYEMNVRQEYKNELILRAIDGLFPVEEAFNDPQAGALSEYIGKDEVTCDYSRRPFTLQPEDVLLLCSDGISDTLTLRQIREAMALAPQACCDKLEQEVLAAGKPNQDNYTAIVLKYHGKSKVEKEES